LRRYLPRWWRIRREKPHIHYWFHPFIKIGRSTKKPGKFRGHYVDYHDNYHIEEERHRTNKQIVTNAFKISTHDPGKYALKMGITADGVDGTAWLDVLVQEAPKRKMRCVEHRFCQITPRPAINSDLEQSEEAERPIKTAANSPS
jgi:hypothetical protein